MVRNKQDAQSKRINIYLSIQKKMINFAHESVTIPFIIKISKWEKEN